VVKVASSRYLRCGCRGGVGPCNACNRERREDEITWGAALVVNSQSMTLLANTSCDSEHELTLGVPTGGSFMRLLGIGKRKRTVDGDANLADLKQACEFREL
jgi:hypothetical protein